MRLQRFEAAQKIQRNSMKRLFNILLAPVIVLMAACHDDPDNTKPQMHYGRTVMVYMAMQNSLGSSNYHKADSAEIANAMCFIPQNDRMLLFIDDAEKPRIYELSKAQAENDPKTGLPYGPKLVKKWDSDVSSASSSTVSEVLEYMKKNYDSDSYGLIMGSHATGWLPAGRGTTANSASRRQEIRPRKTFGVDVGPDGSMSADVGVAGSVADQIGVEDLAKAIGTSGVHPDFILFDACLMQNIEVVYALRNATDFVIASPISISAEGAYYTDLVRNGLYTADVKDVARSYVAYYQGKGSIPYTNGYGTVISCVRTANMESFALMMRQALSEVCSRIDGGTTDMVATLKKVNMEGALAYHSCCKNYYYRPHYYDLLSVMETLGIDAIMMRQLRQMLSETVVYHDASDAFWVGPGHWTMQTMPKDKDAWCGVSMFVPQQLYTDNARECIYGDLNEDFRATEWYKTVFGGDAAIH